MIGSRPACRVLDAALTAGLETPGSVAVPGSRFEPGSPRYRKVRRAFAAVAALLPGAFGRFQRALFDPGWLPFDGTRASVLGFGSATTVFLLRRGAGGPALVLKVYRKSLGDDAGALLEFLDQRRAECRRAWSCYEGSGLLLPTHFLLLHSPLLRRPAVGAVQPFVEGAQRDVFRDVPEGDMLAFLERPGMRAPFHLFVERTLAMAETEGLCVDLVGRNNLILTSGRGPERLVLIDEGMCDLRERARDKPAWMEELDKRLDYLRRLRALSG